MSFANHNILDIALSIIPPTVVQIRKNQGTVVNKYGQSEASYSEWIEVYGIVQPGAEQNEHTQGVDFSKKRVTIWLRGIALDGTHIQWAPDQIRYVGSIYNVVSVTDWYPYDNYRQCECVEAMNLGDSQRSSPAAHIQHLREKISKVAKANPEQAELKFDAPAPAEATPLPSVQEEQPQEVPPQAPPQRKKTVVGKAFVRF